MSSRYPTLLPFTSPTELMPLSEQFTFYQLLENHHIPDSMWTAATVGKGDQDAGKYYRMDVLWSHISNIRGPDCALQFSRLSKVALYLL